MIPDSKSSPNVATNKLSIYESEGGKGYITDMLIGVVIGGIC